MVTYKIVISYDGTNYHGWQVQKDKPTVAQALQDAYEDVFGTPISLIGVSRTDTGVHALGQVAIFRSSLDVPLRTMLFAWNNALPEDIIIRSMVPVADRYNPHNDVIQKTYCYHFYMKRPLPFIARYGMYVRKSVSLERLKEALDIFIGTHDFRSFSTGDGRGDDTIRTIDSISLRAIKRYNAYAIVIKGPKFLRYMIRRVVGAALAYASSPDIPIEELERVLEQKDPRHTFPNAPAKGLVLYKITYKQNNEQ